MGKRPLFCLSLTCLVRNGWHACCLWIRRRGLFCNRAGILQSAPPPDCRHDQQPSFSSGLSMYSTKRDPNESNSVSTIPHASSMHCLRTSGAGLEEYYRIMHVDRLGCFGCPIFGPFPIHHPVVGLDHLFGVDQSVLGAGDVPTTPPPKHPYCLKDARRKIIQ